MTTAKARRPRMSRFPLGLDDTTKQTLRLRARAHGVSMAAYARAAIAGRRPGGMPGQPAAIADEWWDHLSPSRRAQVHGWLTAGHRGEHDIDAHQLAMFDPEEG